MESIVNQKINKKVLILYKSMPQYRVEFFTLLKETLKENGIDLSVIYGSIDSKGKSDARDIDFGEYRENKFFKFGKIQLLWQPAVKEIKKSDLVIVEQANKLLVNYLLLIRRFFFKSKFAFWGHGVNMQMDEGAVFNKFKKGYSNYTDHWFAYTNNVKQRLIVSGYPASKITVVENAIDTTKLAQQYNSISVSETESLKKSMGIEPNEWVFIYCGALYAEKRLDFLIATADELKKLGYNFKLLIVGGGPDAPIVEKASLTRDWLKIVGPKFEREKAAFFKISDLFFMPGAIGLAILDAFALQTPMITTRYDFHGPEYEYLENDVNGIVTDNSLESYVEKIVLLLDDPDKIKHLKENCYNASFLYTVDKMVDNFSKGVIEILK